VWADAEKTNTLRGSISDDNTNSQVTVTWEHHGTTKDSDEKAKGSVKFPSIPGKSDSKTNELANQHQKSEWDIMAFKDPQGGSTPFEWKRVGDNTQSGFVKSTASLGLGEDPKSSESVTTMEADGFSASTKAKISNNGLDKNGKPTSDKKSEDDAFVRTGRSEVAMAEGRISIAHNATIVLDNHTLLQAGNGGAASLIDGDGLRLMDNGSGFAAFSVSGTNQLDPLQSFSWSVRIDSTGLSATGISPSLFVPIAGGVFLPDAKIPAENLTANLGPGMITYSAYDRAFDSIDGTQVATAPEPSTLTLLGIGSFGLLGYGWRRRKRIPA
jgi:hypothetical protein